MKALPTPSGHETGTVTIYDVAARAGVGIATVSRALNGSAPVADATRARVLAAVDELGFRPSHAGTSLAARTHAANGIVFPDLSGPYYAEVLLGYEETASRLGRSVLVLATHGRPDPAAAVRDLAGRVDGLVLLGRTVARRGRRRALRRPARRRRGPAGARRRRLDPHRRPHRRPARSASTSPGTALRRIVFLGSPDESPDVAERWRGIREGLGAHGIEPTVTPCLFDEASGTRVAAALLDGRDRPDALVCANDEIALGAIVAAEEIGLRVGRDIAITGWDDVMAARHARPALTTVRQPMRTLGSLAAEVLDERITGTRTTPRHESLATDLVVRDSCGLHP